MGRRSSVLRSRHRKLIDECLASGWSPETVAWWLKFQYGEADEDIPSPWAIRRYRDRHLPTSRVVPPSLIRERLKGVDYQVDLLRTLARIIWALEQRFGTSWEQDERLLGGLASPSTLKAAQVLLEALRDFRVVAQDLGLFPVGSSRLRLEVHPEPPFSLTEEELRDLEQAAELGRRLSLESGSEEPEAEGG